MILTDSQLNKKKIVKWALIITGTVLFVIFYTIFSPYGNDFFPKCIFNQLTGYKCPGCGSQRAMHYLFNFDLIHAFNENMLLVISIPYLILGAYFDMVKLKTTRQLRIRKMLYGQKAILIILFIVIGFWISRNILNF